MGLGRDWNVCRLAKAYFTVTKYLCYSYLLDLIFIVRPSLHILISAQYILYIFFFGKGAMHILDFTAVT